MKVLLVTVATTLVAADWTGSAACRKCHPSHSGRHEASAHATALRPASEHPLAPRFRTGDKPLARDGYRFSFDSAGVEGYDSVNSIELPLEWAFGAGKQAVTFVTRVNPEWHFEHSFSYYPPLGRFLLTPGHSEIQPGDLKQAAGLLYKTTDPRHGIAGCFECHSTGPVRFAADGSAEIREPGVRCEACHGPASDHIARRARLGPAKRTAAAWNDFCGRCHRPPASDPAKVDWNYSWNVRHQPVYLSQSRCFASSKGRLSCLTCHDPHAPLGSDAAAFNSKCAGCHAKIVARHGGNCVDCHMPRISPQAGLRFSNHWIGIYADGAKLKPLIRQPER
jgi:hypothetical protein